MEMLKRKSPSSPCNKSLVFGSSIETNQRKRTLLGFELKFDDDDDSLCDKSLLELLNFKLGTTPYKSVKINNGEVSSSEKEVVGAYVYFCNNSHLEYVWRGLIVSHLIQRRFGSDIQIRSCRPKSSSKSSSLSSVNNLGANGNEENSQPQTTHSFSHPSSHHSCVIIPVYDMDEANLLFRGAALITALNLHEEPIYFRKGNFSWQAFEDQDSHKRLALFKVEKVKNQIGLYRANGVNWSKLEL